MSKSEIVALLKYAVLSLVLGGMFMLGTRIVDHAWPRPDEKIIFEHKIQGTDTPI